MNFIQRFLNVFDTRPQYGPNAKPPQSVWDISAANMIAASPAARSTATLEQYANRLTAPNGEGVIDKRENRRALLEVAPLSFWKEIEKAAHDA